ncbi:MAG: hypothetical protein JWN40_5553 [Phycisphaerales bacterium]|nr:hypothetical protein [Phycisphaerales bacterium]
MGTLTDRRGLPMFEGLELRRMLSAGQLDATFGSGGIVVTDRGLSGAGPISVDADGKILAAAETDGTSGWQFARYAADGSLDASFGNNGITTWSIGTSGPASWPAELDKMGSAIVAPGGKVLLVGMMQFTDGAGRLAITRYNADGSLDNSFGDHGTAVLTWSPATSPSGGGSAGMETGPGLLHVLSDGSILLARSTGVGPGADVQVVRLTAAGQIDTTFGDDGVATAVDAGVPNLLAVDADGKILVAATQRGMRTIGSMTSDRATRVNVVRFTADGALDTTFGDGGWVGKSAVGNEGQVWARRVVVAPDGKVLLLGNESDGSGPDVDFVIRFNADGSRDMTFGISGRQSLQTAKYDLVVDAHGRSVTAGTAYGGGTRSWIVSQRLNEDGSLDTGYGDGGTATISSATQNYHGYYLSLTADSDVLISGTAVPVGGPATGEGPTDLLLIRLQGGDGALAGVQRDTTGGHHRSPKRRAMDEAAAASHRSPKRRAIDEAAALAAADKRHHRSPKRRAMDEAAAAGGTLVLGSAGSALVFNVASRITIG